MSATVWGGLLVTGLLSACALPERVSSPVRYDFGVSEAAPAAASALITHVQASSALDSTAVLYRLAYADARQLRAYALARWAMPPAELVQQRLRAALSPPQVVLTPDAGAARVLQIKLEEFSQVFDTPAQSSGLLRLHATVLQATSDGHKRLAQREVLVRHPAASADAAGGVRALTAATDAAAAELAHWLQTLPISARP